MNFRFSEQIARLFKNGKKTQTADFSVSRVFSDNMVLQRGELIRVWGFADAKENGKEFKVIFKTTNVKNRNTSFISCMDSGIGLDMKVEDANIYSSNGSLYSPYCEEDIIEFEFNINTSDNIPLVMTYEDGVGCRPMIYNSDSSFWHIRSPLVRNSSGIPFPVWSQTKNLQE